MEVENKGKPPSFPSNYVTIHQLRQRWLQRQSPSSLPTTVIPESNHRDDGDVIESSSAAASKKTTQNDAASAHSSPPPPPVTKSPSSSNNNNNNEPPFSSISSSGGFKKKSQNPAKTKSPSSQQQQQSPSSSSLLPTTVIPKSNHRDSNDVVESSSSTAVSKKPSQNDPVSAPPPVTKSPSSYNTNNRASVESSSASKKPPQNDTVSARFSKSPSSYYNKNKTPFSSISSSGGGGYNKKPQNDAVSLQPSLGKIKSPVISQKNRIVSKTLKETIFGNPQKPEPKHTDNATTNTSILGIDSANDSPISVSNDDQVLKKKKRIRKKKRVLPDQNVTGANSLSETDPKLELEVEALVVGESKMGQELEEVVVVEKKQKPKEIRRRRNWDNKGEGECKVKTASFDQNKPGAGDDNVVEPKAEPELEAVRESEMGQELEEVVVEKKHQQTRESRGCRDWNKKRVKEFKDKTASFDQNKQAVGDDNVVEPEAEPELEVEMEVVVWKGQESPELGGCRKSNKKVVRELKMGQESEEVVVVKKKQIPMETTRHRNWDKKGVWEYKPKTASFSQYDSNNSNNVDNNVDVGGGVKAVEDDKVVGNGDVVKENSTRDSGKLDHQGKQSLKAASFDQDQDTSDSPVKERDAVNTNYNTNYYNRNRNATGNGVSNWRMGSGRFRGHRIQRPSYSKSLVSTRKGEVWVQKGNPSNPTYHHLRKVPIAREDKADS